MNMIHHKKSMENNNEIADANIGKARRKRLGQGMLEFALVLPIFLLLLYGVVEFGRYLTAIITINTSSREAARYASGVGDNGSGTPFYQDCAGIEAAAMRQGLFAGYNSIDIRYDSGPDDPTDPTLLPTCSSTVKVGLADRVSVTVHGQYTPLLIFTEMTFPLQSTTTRTLVTKLDVRSTQYAMDTPEPEETPEVDLCTYLSYSSVTPETTTYYSFTITNSSPVSENFNAVLDELWFEHNLVNANSHFESISIIDETDPANPYTLLTETYGILDKKLTEFSYLPYNLGLIDPRTGQPLGVPGESTYRIRFSLSDATMSWSTVRVSYFNVNCPHTMMQLIP